MCRHPFRARARSGHPARTFPGTRIAARDGREVAAKCFKCARCRRWGRYGPSRADPSRCFRGRWFRGVGGWLSWRPSLAVQYRFRTAGERGRHRTDATPVSVLRTRTSGSLLIRDQAYGKPCSWHRRTGGWGLSPEYRQRGARLLSRQTWFVIRLGLATYLGIRRTGRMVTPVVGLLRWRIA